jgi:hypothetical protein
MNATREHYLAELETFFADSQVCCDCSRLLEHFSIRLAALGRAAEVLAIIEQSSESGLFASLADGLRLHLGRTVEDPSSNAGEIALQIHQAVTEFAFDNESEAEQSFEHEAEIDYGFARAAVPAA